MGELVGKGCLVGNVWWMLDMLVYPAVFSLPPLFKPDLLFSQLKISKVGLRI